METRTLTTYLKHALKAEQNCIVEIRAPQGARSQVVGERLLKSLTLAGVKTKLICVAATPSPGILIEATQECAGAALSLQTAFRGAGLETHLLIQEGTRQDAVIIHLGQDQKIGSPK